MIGTDRAHQVGLETSVGSVGTYAETNRLRKMSNLARRYPTSFFMDIEMEHSKNNRFLFSGGRHMLQAFTVVDFNNDCFLDNGFGRAFR